MISKVLRVQMNNSSLFCVVGLIVNDWSPPQYTILKVSFLNNLW